MMHHIELYVSDLKASARFWGWFLGELGYRNFKIGTPASAGKTQDFMLCLYRQRSVF